MRLLGISVSGFQEENQLSMFDSAGNKDVLDEVMLKIRDKFGHNIIKRGNALVDEKIAKSMDRVQLDKLNKDE